MTLSITASVSAPTCMLSVWQVTDFAELVKALSWSYLRKPRHAQRVMQALEPGAAGFPGRIFQNAITSLTYETTDIAAGLSSADPDVAKSARDKLNARIQHRDGLLFQHISWVAAFYQFPGAIARAPHVRKADKGFDGVLIELGVNGSVTRLVLCEDKASTNPRNLVVGSIWPELIDIDTGRKDVEILDVVTGLLESISGLDVEGTLLATTWGRNRQYRVALTAGPTQVSSGSYAHLFDGFDQKIAGPIDRRMGDVFPMTDVRSDLDALAAHVIAGVKKIAADV